MYLCEGGGGGNDILSKVCMYLCEGGGGGNGILSKICTYLYALGHSIANPCIT